MGGAAPTLEELAASELAQPSSRAAQSLAGEIQRRHGDALAAVVFYGSCLRKQTDEGVLDFYALVDDYASAYRSRALAVANAALPPNVFYLETPDGTARCKYAVVSQRDFQTGASAASRRSGIWARFSQPAALVFARDDASREAVVRAAAESVRTAVRKLLPLLPGDDGVCVFSSADFWQLAFRETYSVEMRTESPETIRSLYAASPERYDAALAAALRDLARSGEAEVETLPDGIRVAQSAGVRRRARRAWRGRRPALKLLYLVGLGKSVFTFGDWLPYALWKLQRHSGHPVELTERQRNHPLIFGWPVLVRLLWERRLR